MARIPTSSSAWPLRTFIRVGGALRPALSVENLTAHYRGTSNPVGGGSATVSYTVRNTGNVRLGAHQRVVVSGILGADTPARALADVPLLLPKSSIRMSVRIPDVLPQFHLTARVTLYPLVVPGDADPGTPKQITASAGFWAVPWVLIGVLVVLLAAGFGLWLWRRRRARRSADTAERAAPPWRRPERWAEGPRHEQFSVLSSRRRCPCMISTLDRFIAMLGVAATSALVGWAPAAVADSSLPFTDASAVGSIGICDASGDQITSGDIGRAPFAATVVSSVPAPQGYGAGIGRAVLNVYQPRQGVEPGEWSGKGLTAATLYTNTAHPMAQGTGLDPALVDFTSVFHPEWQGLVELRMYFTAPDKPQHTIQYPATVLKVTGTKWTVVSGAASAPCKAGQARSVESIAIPKSILTQPTARVTPGAKAAGSSSSGSTGRGAGTASTTSTGSGGAVTPAGSTAAAGTLDAKPAASSTSSDGSGATVLVVLLLVVALAGGLIARRRGWLSRR